MAHITADRVRDTSVSTASPYIVTGTAPTGYQTFSAVMAAGDTCYYAIQHRTAAQWEVGLGTYTTNTITRTVTLSSSNSNNPVTFSAGTKDVFITIPASRAAQVAPDGTVTLPASSKVGTALIAPQGAVTASGLTTAAGSRLVGRATATAGALEEIIVGTGLTLSSSAPLTLSSSGTVTSVSATSTANGYSLIASGTTAVTVTLGVSNSDTARSTLVAAKSGANNDITSLTNLTTPLAVSYGGTGATTLTGYVKGNGTAALTSATTIPVADLSGTVTVAQGGTGAITSDAARTNLVAAKSGANSDITSLSNITTPLSVLQGGTGANLAANARTNLGAAASGLATDSGLTTASGARLLGRANAAAGALEEISLRTGLTLSGTTLNAATAASPGGTVNVLDFSADPTGAVSSSTAFQNAINSLGTLGGTVLVPPGKFLLSTSITVGDTSDPYSVGAVTLKGCYSHIGEWQGNFSGDPTAATVSALRLGDSATIRLMGSCGLEGLLIVRNNFVFTKSTPSFGTGSLAVSAISSYDPFVKDCAIYGFAQAISASNSSRVRITDVNIDCTNGVLINNSADVSYITRVHCWPFVNHIAGEGANPTPNPANTAYQRTGSAFKLTGLNDWTKITDCFAYAYYRDYDIVAGDEITLTGCGADQTPNVHAGAIGFLIGSGATNVSMVNCQAAGHQTGFYVTGTTTNTTRMVNCSAWQNTDNGVANLAGILTMFGGNMKNNASGINIAGGTVYASGVRMIGNTTNGAPTAMPTTIV